MCTILPPKVQNVYRSGLIIGIGALWDNSAHRNIRESLSGSAGVGRFPSLNNLCTFGLDSRLDARYIPATELYIIMFRLFPLGELVWHIIKQVNYSDLDAYITVFDPSRGKRRFFIPFLVYALVYPIIASNLVTLDTLSPWYESFCTYT